MHVERAIAIHPNGGDFFAKFELLRGVALEKALVMPGSRNDERLDRRLSVPGHADDGLDRSVPCCLLQIVSRVFRHEIAFDAIFHPDLIRTPPPLGNPS